MIVVSAIVAVLILLGIGVYSTFFYTGSASYAAWQPIEVTLENLPNVMEQTPYVQELPRGALIELYIGSTPYTIVKGSLEEGSPANPDVTIKIPEKYLSVMGQYGVCAMVYAANKAGELTVEAHQSGTSLGWKYKTLVKYKDCLS